MFLVLHATVRRHRPVVVPAAKAALEVVAAGGVGGKNADRGEQVELTNLGSGFRIPIGSCERGVVEGGIEALRDAAAMLKIV